MTLPERTIDPRAIARGVTIDTPVLLPGQSFWRVVNLRWFDEQEARALGPNHHIMLDAIAHGGRAYDLQLLVKWPDGAHRVTIDKKASEAYGADFPMSPSRNEFSVTVTDPEPSETVRGIGMGADTPTGYNPGIHTSTAVIFQLVTAAESPVPTLSPARYAFAPVSDITAYELALCMLYLVDKQEPDATVLPPWAMRHWMRVS